MLYEVITNHIKDAPQKRKHSVLSFISSCGAFLYQSTVQMIAANTVTSSVICVYSASAGSVAFFS